jgi:5-methylcytosine-specific restriction endonuclease McrA
MIALVKDDAAPTRRDVRGFLGSAEWRDQKGAALYLKGRRCERPGCDTPTKGPFHVDHIVPVRVSWAARLSMWNLQVLCARCHTSHKRREENRRRWRYVVQELVSRGWDSQLDKIDDPLLRAYVIEKYCCGAG